MSYVAKTYEFIEKIESILNRKLFKTVFIAISSMILFFGVMNVYAQVDETTGAVSTSDITVKGNYSGMKEYINLANGVDADETNKGTGGVTDAGVTLFSVVAVLDPSVTPGADQIQQSENIPEDMKAGLIGIADNTITYAYNNYPSSNVYKHLAEEWVPGYDTKTTSTYAADDTIRNGYDTLMNSGISELWGKVRNLAYVFFVVIMIAVGFMIMFRSKIGGQTLVSLGNFLPGVITSLILITFSFAIAGLLIDLGGVVTSMVAGIYGGDNLFSINSLGEMMKGLITGSVQNVATGAGAGGAAALGIGGVLSLLVQAGFAGVLGAAAAPVILGIGIIGLLVALLIMGVVFVGGIKVIITLYKAYFGILLGVIIAPIQIMVGAFPGQSYATGNWFKSLLKNVLTFPMVFAIVNFPSYLAGQSDISLSLPAKLSYATTNTNALGVNNGIFLFIIRVIVLYFAAEAPKYLEAWFPSDTPKPVAEGFANAKASLSKVPLVGGLFK
jgi:hypothetical protein